MLALGIPAALAGAAAELAGALMTNPRTRAAQPAAAAEPMTIPAMTPGESPDPEELF